MSKDNILHELIDVVSGRQAHLTAARAIEMHDEITPGYSDQPVTEAEAAAAQDVLDRLQREADKRAEAAAAAAPAVAAPVADVPEPAV